MKKRIILIWMFVLVTLTCGVYFSYNYYQEIKRQKVLLEKRKTSWLELKQTIGGEIAKFKGDVGVVIKDLTMNWEISFNEDKLFPSASLVKIPIMASCFSAIRERKLKFENIVKLKLTDKVSGSGILKNMHTGKELSIEELLELMITDSDNTATNVLIDQLGLDYLNMTFKSLGLKDTNLARKMMDFKSRSQGIENYTTAKDIALILEKIYRKDLINRDVSLECVRLLKQQKINGRISLYLPSEVTVAHKTGLERFVCHDAGIVYTCKGNFLICVLTKHSRETTSRVAKKFIARIALITYRYFEKF